MINILIVDDNLNFTDTLHRYLSNIENFKVWQIDHTGENTMNCLKSKKIDILLLDLDLSNTSGLTILNDISFNRSEFKNLKVVIISGKSELIAQWNSYTYINHFFLKPINYTDLLKYLLNITAVNNDSNIEKYIENSLNKLNFLYTNSGTIYLYELLLYIFQNHIELPSLNSLYTIIAKKHKISTTCVKRNIEYSVNCIRNTNISLPFDQITPKSIIMYILSNYNKEGSKLWRKVK